MKLSQVELGDQLAIEPLSDKVLYGCENTVLNLNKNSIHLFKVLAVLPVNGLIGIFRGGEICLIHPRDFKIRLDSHLHDDITTI